MWGIPLLGDSCERWFFYLRGGGAFLFLQLLQKSLHTAQALFLRSPLPIHLFTTNTTFIHHFYFKSKHCYWKCFFIDSFFFYSNTIFIDVFKCNKYKKPIIQCFFTFAFRLLLDLYIKLLKQVEKHFKVIFLCNHKHSKLTYDCQLYRILFRI